MMYRCNHHWIAHAPYPNSNRRPSGQMAQKACAWKRHIHVTADQGLHRLLSNPRGTLSPAGQKQAKSPHRCGQLHLKKGNETRIGSFQAWFLLRPPSISVLGHQLGDVFSSMFNDKYPGTNECRSTKPEVLFALTIGMERNSQTQKTVKSVKSVPNHFFRHRFSLRSASFARQVYTDNTVNK